MNDKKESDTISKLSDALGKWHSTVLNRASDYYVNKDPKLKRGLVHCFTCGAVRQVNSAKCLRSGWPKCCGKIMSLDSPEERHGECK